MDSLNLLINKEPAGEILNGLDHYTDKMNMYFSQVENTDVPVSSDTFKQMFVKFETKYLSGIHPVAKLTLNMLANKSKRYTYCLERYTTPIEN